MVDFMITDQYSVIIIFGYNDGNDDYVVIGMFRAENSPLTVDICSFLFIFILKIIFSMQYFT